MRGPKIPYLAIKLGVCLITADHHKLIQENFYRAMAADVLNTDDNVIYITKHAFTCASHDTKFWKQKNCKVNLVTGLQHTQDLRGELF